MAHHKRHRPKQQRAGCLFCKPHKANCSKDSRHSILPRDARRMEPIALPDALADYLDEIDERNAMPRPDCPCADCRAEFADRAV